MDVTWLASVGAAVIVIAGMYGWMVRTAVELVPPMDPAIAEDRQWEGIEAEWQEFVDSFGVREVQR